MHFITQAVVSENANTEHLCSPQSFIMVQQSNDFKTADRRQNIDDHACMAAGPEPYDFSHHVNSRINMKASAYSRPIVAPRNRASARMLSSERGSGYGCNSVS